jgi:hypothetical protein
MAAAALTGRDITRLMNINHMTIRGLAAAMNITQKRVRYVREHGVTGEAFVTDWLEAIDVTLLQTDFRGWDADKT